MKIESTKAVGKIASEIQAAIPLFEDMKIDYCCGGNRTLKDACDLAGVPVEKVVSSLEKLQSETPKGRAEADWRNKSMNEITDHILEKHHTYTHFQLIRLKELADKVAQVHGARHLELAGVKKLVREMAEELEGHMAKEEEQVFPYLKATEKNGGKKEKVINPFAGRFLDQHPLRVLMWEHGMTGEEFGELHRLTSNFTPPSDACGSYQALYRGLRELEEDLHRHVHLENNILFPKAEEQGILD